MSKDLKKQAENIDIYNFIQFCNANNFIPKKKKSDLNNQ